MSSTSTTSKPARKAFWKKRLSTEAYNRIAVTIRSKHGAANQYALAECSRTAAVCAGAVFVIAMPGSAYADEPFQLNAQDSVQQQSYPTPQLMQDKYTAVSPVLSSSVHTQVVLPPPFLGAWNVKGQRMKIDALPEFQQSAQTAFSPTTANVWEITGDPGSGYSLGSNTGVKTQLIVDKVQGNQAYIRYAHPIGKTVAQEAIIMQLGPGGHSFTGLERITIVKGPNLPARARVTYQLSGSRQP